MRTNFRLLMKKNIENGMIKEKEEGIFNGEIYPCGRFTYGSVI